MTHNSRASLCAAQTAKTTLGAGGTTQTTWTSIRPPIKPPKRTPRRPRRKPRKHGS